MITLNTSCNKCTYEKMCKNKNNAKTLCERLKDMTFGDGPNDDYDWNTMSNRYGVKIEFSCPDFRQETPTPRSGNWRD